MLLTLVGHCGHGLESEPRSEGVQNLSPFFQGHRSSGYHLTGKGLTLPLDGPRNVHWQCCQGWLFRRTIPDAEVSQGEEISRVFHLNVRCSGDWTRGRWFLNQCEACLCSWRSAMCPRCIGHVGVLEVVCSPANHDPMEGPGRCLTIPLLADQGQRGMRRHSRDAMTVSK